MHLFVCLTSFMLTIHLSTLRASNSSETTESTVGPLMFYTLAPNTTLKINSESPSESQLPMLNTTASEATSSTTNSLDLAPNESSNKSPTTSFATEASSHTEIQTELMTRLTTDQESTKSPSTTTSTITLRSSSTTPTTTEDQGIEISTMNTVLSSTEHIQMILRTSLSPVISENITPYEEVVEHNAIPRFYSLE
ncbi:uncharacterized protein LOC129962849 [Argiope bruennichi]|uniref:uncharacterized protein LOC129962849 n=1 Tax=Argiope bruennichi TaxID=94029 RepID=UPI002494054B|nr:uncharacterized protein LOC129962849 [Argiope bruennichi]